VEYDDPNSIELFHDGVPWDAFKSTIISKLDANLSMIFRGLPDPCKCSGISLYYNEQTDYTAFCPANIYYSDQSGRAVSGMSCLRSLERLDRGFESHSKAWMSVLVCIYSVFVFFCM
jgi:hypothetical protein